MIADEPSHEDDMHTMILLAVLHGYVSIPPIRTFRPFPDVKCPAGYSIWWPPGKEFDNDRFAECIKPARTERSGVVKSGAVKNVSLGSKVALKSKAPVERPR